jgi:hypothetical protein
MLYDDSAFRLSSITNSNDLKEGITLLDYLFGDGNFENNTNKEDIAFVGSFSFNHNNLTMFRLYGKENNCEGTGVSIVLNSKFFSEDIKQCTTEDISNVKEIKEEYPLLGCLYIDPLKGVVAIGHDDDEKDDGNKFLNEVNQKLMELKQRTKGLDRNVVSQLLLNLRYLTKHSAFKEEQECRIVKIYPVGAPNVHPSEDYKHLYIDYLQIQPYVEKVYLGSKFTDAELYHDILHNKGINIKIEPSGMPLQ